MSDSHLKLLIVDDNPADAGLLQRHLENSSLLDVELVHALSAAAAMAKLAEDDFDCVILDYQLGGVSGLDFLQAVREAGDDVPVIALTGVGSEAVAVAAMKSGAQDYLVKDQLSPETLRRSIQAAVETVKLQRTILEQHEELQAFVDSASHDLLAPLRQIRQFMHLLDEETELSSEQVAYLEKMDSAGARMQTLIEKLLEFARQGQRGELSHVELDEILAEVSADLAAKVDAVNGQLRIEKLPAVRGDPVGLRQLFQNLLANGIKFNQQATPVVQVTATEVAEGWEIQIADNGIGIEKQQNERIFTAFARSAATENYEGFGLGLATVARVVKQHGGRIWVDSTPGCGSVFHVILPKLETSAAAGKCSD